MIFGKKKTDVIRINRRIIVDIRGNEFAVYGFEYLSEFGCWIEKYNFTNKQDFEDHIKTIDNEYIKVGDWISKLYL